MLNLLIKLSDSKFMR